MTKEEIISIIGKYTTHEVTMESKLVDDLGIDSIDGIELQMDIEHEIGKALSMDYYFDGKDITVSDVVDIIRKEARNERTNNT